MSYASPARRPSASLCSRTSLLKALALSSCLALTALSGCGQAPDQDDLDAIQEEQELAESRDGGRPSTRTDSGTRPSPTTPRADGGSTVPTPRPSADGGVAPNPLAPGDRTPSPDNIKECPPVAPDNPVGSCIGVPIYATCSYTTYNCICDWYHWICI